MNDADWALQALICYRVEQGVEEVFCSVQELRPRKEVEEEGTKTPRVKTPTTAHH